MDNRLWHRSSEPLCLEPLPDIVAEHLFGLRLGYDMVEIIFEEALDLLANDETEAAQALLAEELAGLRLSLRTH